MESVLIYLNVWFWQKFLHTDRPTDIPKDRLTDIYRRPYRSNLQSLKNAYNLDSYQNTIAETFTSGPKSLLNICRGLTEKMENTIFQTIPHFHVKVPISKPPWILVIQLIRILIDHIIPGSMTKLCCLPFSIYSTFIKNRLFTFLHLTRFRFNVSNFNKVSVRFSMSLYLDNKEVFHTKYG